METAHLGKELIQSLVETGELYVICPLELQWQRDISDLRMNSAKGSEKRADTIKGRTNRASFTCRICMWIRASSPWVRALHLVSWIPGHRWLAGESMPSVLSTQLEIGVAEEVESGGLQLSMIFI